MLAECYGRAQTVENDTGKSSLVVLSRVRDLPTADRRAAPRKYVENIQRQTYNGHDISYKKL